MAKLRTSVDKLLLMLKEKHGDTVSIDVDTFVGMNQKARFIDSAHGEWWATPTKVITCGQHHPNRNKRLSLNEILDTLRETHGGKVSLDVDSYVTSNKKAKFIDVDYGEWWAPVYKVVFYGQSHPKRKSGKLSAARARTHTTDEFKLRMSETIKAKMPEIAKTNVERFGVTSVLLLPRVVEVKSSRFKTPEALARKEANRASRRARLNERRRSKRVKSKPEDRIKKLQLNGVAKDIDGKSLKEIWAASYADKISYSFACKIFERYACASEADFKASLDRHVKMSDVETLISSNPLLKRFDRFPAPGCSIRPDFKVSDQLFVNVDGLYWHSEAVVGRRYHHLAREKAEAFNIRLLQFRADEVVYKRPIVDSMIAVKAGKVQTRLHARKLKLDEVTALQTKEFLRANHLMGFASASRYFTLMDGLDIKCLLSVKIEGRKAKIVRFASALNTVVVGGYSKLLKHVLATVNLDEIYTFVDLRYGDVGSLKKLGFEHVGTTLGWKWTDYDKTYNRLRCRANMDSRLLAQKAYAKELKLYKIHDAGQAKMVLKLCQR
jgi:hypothetical protein